MPWWGACLFMGMGVFIVLVSVDVIHFDATHVRRRSAIFKDPHHWQITCIGLAFFFAGIQVLISKKKGLLVFMNGLAFALCFFAPMIWFFYLSGIVEWGFAAFASIPLLIGGAGMVFGLIQAAQGKSAVVDLSGDPVLQAKVLSSCGSTAQARQILADALKKYPERANEISKCLEKINLKDKRT